MKFSFKEISRRDVFIAVLILFVSFGYYFTLLIPNDTMEIDMYFFKIGKSGFPDVKTVMTYTKMKILIITYSSIWFFTCKHWWKSSILVIITIEFLKLISAFDPNQRFFDEIEYYTSLPITIPIVLLLVYFSNKLNKYNLAKEVRSQIDHQIDAVFFEIHSIKQNELNDIEEKFLKLKSNKEGKNSSEYLSELIALRNECYKE